jgi:hypothetical protein
MKHRVLQKACSAALGIALATTSVSSLATVYAAEDGTEQTQEQTVKLTNIASQATLTASSSYPNAAGWAPESLVDGNYSSQWVAGSSQAPQYVLFTFKEAHDFYKLVTVFENRDDQRATGKQEIMKYEVSYLNEDNEFVVFESGQNYDEDNNYTHTTESDSPLFTTKVVKVTITERIDAGAWPSLMEVELYSDTEEPQPDPTKEVTNLALHKTVTASAGSPSCITDGSLGGYWDGGAYPSSFTIDLGTGAYIDSMKGVTYYGDGRYYNYKIYVSTDGRKYTQVAAKTDTTVATSSGDTFYFDEPVYGRYVRVKMTYNSANEAVHMREFEVWGTADPDYVEPEPSDEKIDDPENIALGKSVRSSMNKTEASKVVDGSIYTEWEADYFPTYVDIDLEDEYNLSEVILNLQYDDDDRYYWYTIYGSNDYVNFDRLYVKNNNDLVTEEGDTIDLSRVTTPYRFIRVYVQNVSNASNAAISEIRVHGTVANTDNDTDRSGTIDELLGIQDYDLTDYATPITEDETIENVYGIVERTVGEKYRDWFEFELAENKVNSYDYFEISSNYGKIHIKGNDGVSIASGLNYYYKYYCNVEISEQASQVKMPDEIVLVDGTIRKENPYEVRYGMNYCTLDYTFAFFGADEWQHENDWLALNGVNVVLDLAGQEAVWIKFLQNFGYSVDDAKDWLAGPSYYAWQFMDNLETFGGPVSDGWVVDRLNMARENQRWKNSLGMQTVLQGYAGMVPTNFSEYVDVDILEQGGWCGLDRPDMIRTDGELYDTYAELFYDAQRWALGETSNYYAVDPFHEGGKRPSDLSDSTIAAEVLDSLLKYDPDAVWMVQAWWSNPTNELLEGMGDYRQNHVLILDLTAFDSPKWNTTSYGSTTLDSDEFDGTDWVWCILKNYGGNTSADGDLEKLAADIPAAKANSEHMKGVGFISEATYDNPVVYNLLFEICWQDGEIDVNDWLDDYVVRRYGAYSESARKAWDILLDTVYSRTGNSGQIFTSTPSSRGSGGIAYKKGELEKALDLLLEDYDLLKDSDAYIYDLQEFGRQQVNDYAILKYNEVISAYKSKDLEAFKKAKEEFLNAFDVADQILSTWKDSMVGEWIGRALDWAENYDDFSEDSLKMNATALITTWAGRSSAASLPNYAYRHYAGMLLDVYKSRWSDFLDYEEKLLEGEDATYSYAVFDDYWDWAINTPTYSRTPITDRDEIRAIYADMQETCYFNTSTSVPDTPANKGNIAVLKEVEASKEVNSGGSNGGYASYTVDGDVDSYWDGGDYSLRPTLIVNLGANYTLDSINIRNYVVSGRYYNYEVYVSQDKENWTLAYIKSDTSNADAGYTYTFEDGINAQYIKVVGTYNSANEAFHITELRAYGTDYYTQLAAVIEAAEATDTSAWDAEHTEALQKALAAAKEAYADGQSKKDVLISTHDALAEALDYTPDVQPETVNKAYLVQAIAEAESDSVQAELAKAIPAVQQVFALALSNAKAVNDNADATQDEVNTAWKNLVTAIQYLSLTGDKTELNALIAEVEALTPSDYTADSWNAVDSALTDAKAVAADENALQDAIDKAYDALKAAKDALEDYTEPSTVNKTLLDDSIAKADELKAAGAVDNAVDAVKQLFDLALANAKEVSANPDATQDEVDTAWKNLVTAIQSLSLTADKTALNELIAEVEALDEFDYTDDSWADVETALAAAKAVQANGNALQDAIDEAYDSLKAAKDALEDYVEPVTVSKVLLNNSISYAEKVKEEGALDNVVASEKEAFELALANAKAVSADENATQDEVDKAWSDLVKAITRLSLTGNKDDLSKLVAQAEAKNEADYTPSTWNALAEPLANAKAVLDNDDALQADIDAAISALQTALDGLKEAADKTALEEAVKNAEAVNADDYTDASLAAISDPLAAAKAVLNDAEADQEAVDAAAKALNDALAALVKVADKTALQNTVNAADALNADDYTPATYANIAAPLADAKAALADKNASQETVDAAAKALNDAVAALVKAADKTALNDAVAKADALDASAYTEDTYAAVADALEDAKAVQADANASQADVDAAADALNKALDALAEVPAVDTETYKYLVEQVTEKTSGTNLDQYVDGEAKDAFVAELAKAEDILANATTQEEVDAATKALNQAYLNLRFKPNEETLKTLQELLNSLNTLALALDDEDAVVVFSMRTRIMSALNSNTLDAVTAANLAVEAQNLIVEYADKAEPTEEVKQITAGAQEKADELQAVADAIAAGQQEGISPDEAVAKLEADKADSVTPADDTAETVKPADTSTEKSVSKNDSTSNAVQTGVTAMPFAALGAAALAALKAMKRNRKK